MTTTTMKMPDLGEGVVEAELVSWLVSEGDAVTTQTPIADVQTDKASVEISAPTAGVVTAILVDEGAIVSVGTDILAIATDEAGGAPTPATEPDPTSVPTPVAAVREPAPARTDQPTPVRTDERPSRALAAPTVRRLAKEHDVDLGRLTGSGPGGRILRTDVEAYLQRTDAVARGPVRRPDEVRQLRGVRRTIAHRLTAAWEAPHITLVEDADVTELESLREALKESLAADGVRLTPLAFVARAIVLACADHPDCNATFDAQADALTLHGAVHLGIATQTDQGLMVPVVRDADQLSMSATADGIGTAAAAARDGSASREQLSGSTITVSSLGALGGLMNTPILNAPEVAIVGVNRMRTEPVWDGNTFVPRTIVHLSASFDHRVIDGWDAAVFVQRIKELLETPALLTLGWTR